MLGMPRACRDITAELQWSSPLGMVGKSSMRSGFDSYRLVMAAVAVCSAGENH